MARYLVTGGAGFIGSTLAEALIARGDHVVVLDDLSTGRRANVEHLLRPANGNGRPALELIEGSVLDEDLVEECLRQADVCLHLASVVGVKLVVRQARESLIRNVRGAEVVISAAARHGRRLLFTSTSEIYGKSSGGPLDEDADRILGSPFVSRWSYATAKAFGESLAHEYHREEGAPNTVVRLFNTVGPRQRAAYGMVLPRFVRQALAGDDLTVYGAGTQSRCFAHVHDVVEAILLLCDDPRSVGQVFNIGSPAPVAIVDLAAKVIKRSGSRSRIAFVPYAEAYGEGFAELPLRTPDCTRLERLTGWRPRRTVEDAIDDVIAYQRSGAVDPPPAFLPRSRRGRPALRPVRAGRLAG
jgi:UDP-glucose 4-epimerase